MFNCEFSSFSYQNLTVTSYRFVTKFNWNFLVIFCSENDGENAGAGGKKGEESLESRIEELRHRLRIESACLEGAKNVLKLLQSTKNPEKKALQEVRTMKESLLKLKTFRSMLDLSNK